MTTTYRERVRDCYNWRPTSGGAEDESSVKLPLFDGTGKCNEFFEELEEFFEVKAVDEKIGHIYLRRSLRGKALDYYKAFVQYKEPEQGSSKYKTFKKALLAAFPARRNNVQLEAEFFASRQRASEAPEAFVSRMTMLHRELNLEYVPQKLVEHIVNRLKPEVQDFLELRKIESGVELYDVLARYTERRQAQRVPPHVNEGRPSNYFHQNRQQGQRSRGGTQPYQQRRQRNYEQGLN